MTAVEVDNGATIYIDVISLDDPDAPGPVFGSRFHNNTSAPFCHADRSNKARLKLSVACDV